MDAASAVAVQALRLPRVHLPAHAHAPAHAPFTVFDICCCPGAKLIYMSDILAQYATATASATASATATAADTNTNTNTAHRGTNHGGDIVALDISRGRLNVCKSLLHQVYEFKIQTALQLQIQMQIQMPVVLPTSLPSLKLPRVRLFCADGATFQWFSPAPSTAVSLADGGGGGEAEAESGRPTGELFFDSLCTESEADAAYSNATRNAARSAAGAAAAGIGNGNAIGTGHAAIPFPLLRSNKSARAREQKGLRALHAHTTGPGYGNACEIGSFLKADSDSIIYAPDAPTLPGSFSLYSQQALFDRVIVDAECSHTGSYRHMRYLEEQHPAQPLQLRGVGSQEELLQHLNGANEGNPSPTDSHANTINKSFRSNSGGNGPLVTKPTAAYAFKMNMGSRAAAAPVDCRGGKGEGEDGSEGEFLLRRLPSEGGSKRKLRSLYESEDAEANTAVGATADTHRNLYDLQNALLLNGYMHCKPGGIVVYSTCSDDVKQNEEVVMELLKHPAAQGAILLDPMQSEAAVLPLSVASDDKDADAEIEIEIDAMELLKRPLSEIYAYYSTLSDAERIHLSTVVCRQVCRQACVPIEVTQLVGGKEKEEEEEEEKEEKGREVMVCRGKVAKLSFHGGTSGLFIAAIQKPPLREPVQ